MQRTFEGVYRIYGMVIFVAALIAGAATFLIMCLVALSAFLRTLFNAPIPASVEISQSLLVLCITFPFAYTLMKKEHVRTVVLAHRFPERLQRFIYAIWMVFGLIIFSAATYGTWRYGIRSYNMNEMVWGAAIQFPLWPSKMAVSIGLGMLTVQFALEAIGTLLIPGFAPMDDEAHDQNVEINPVSKND